jgi:predicted ATPase
VAVNRSNSACAVLSSISVDGLCENRPFDGARRCIGEATAAIETTKERWREAEVNRMVGEIALNSPGPDVAKAQGYFDRALSVAREQQAKSRELRAAMSMARLWRDQGKRDEARDLLAPVYGWFIEGLETLDLKQVKLCSMRFRRESIGCTTRT